MDLMTQHLEKVRGRLAREDLSLLELRELRQQKIEQWHGQSQSSMARERLQAEAALIDEIIAEQTPEPTIEDQIQALKDQGKSDAAANLERAHNIDQKRSQIEKIQSELVDAEAWRKGTLEKNLEAARDELAELQGSHPVFDRIAQGRSMRDEALKQQDEALALRRAGNVETRQRGERMQGEALEKLEEAQRMINGAA